MVCKIVFEKVSKKLPKQVSYRFPGIDYRIVSIQRGKVPIPTGGPFIETADSFVSSGVIICLFCTYNCYVNLLHIACMNKTRAN